MFSKSLAAYCRATYIRHIKVGKPMIKCQVMLLHDVKLVKGASVVSALGVTVLADASVYLSC